MLSSKHDLDLALMSSLELKLPGQDPYKTEPTSIPVCKGKNTWKLTPAGEPLLLTAGGGASIFANEYTQTGKLEEVLRKRGLP